MSTFPSFLFSLTLAMLAVPTVPAVGQAPCAGQTVGLASIGQVTHPPAVSAPILETYTSQFTVPQSGVWSLEGNVTLGCGAGANVTFSQVEAVIDGVAVMAEDPPAIDGNPPNGWIYVWSYQYYSIYKPYARRLLLQANTTYTLSITAQGFNTVGNQYHPRHYGVQMTCTGVFCGPEASAVGVGQGCVGPNPPTLSSPLPPVLGTVRDLVITGTPSAIAVAVLGIETPVPGYLGAGCFVQLDLAGPLLPLAAFTGPTGVGYAIYQIPPNPSLAGARFAAQGLVFDAASPLGLHLTQGLILTLGY